MLSKLNSRHLCKDFQALQCFSTDLEENVFTLYGTESKLKSHTSKPDA